MTATTNLNAGHWTAGQAQPEVTVNTALDIMDGLADVFVHDMASDADYTLATAGTAPFEWQHLVIQVTDTGVLLTTGRNIIVPTAYTRAYIFSNSTAQTLTVKTVAGTGIGVLTGTTQLLRADGVNVVELPNFA